jgi:tetraacyldisaccharide 4'-kinase
MGRRPAVVLRGYKRHSKGLLVVHDGVATQVDVRRAGDEAMLHARTLNVPVVVCESKVDAARYAASVLSCDTIVVDDGFQHRALARDVDIVLVDHDTIHRPWLAPHGMLREPLRSLSRADVVLLTQPTVTAADVQAYVGPDTIIDTVRIQPGQPYMLRDNTPAVLSGPLIAASAIAHPERFLHTLDALGVNVVRHVAAPDHHEYSRADLDELLTIARQRGAGIVMTEKDAVKLDAFMDVDGVADIMVLPVSAHLIDGDQRISTRLAQGSDQ